MIKKYLIFPILSRILDGKAIGTIIFVGALMVTGTANAITNCDDQSKPAFDCPTGYSMMCIPVGGNHWGCGKPSNGVIVESSGSASVQTSGIKSTMQTQVKTSNPNLGEVQKTGPVRLDSTPARISTNMTIERQTPKKDFGDRMKSGLDTAGGNLANTKRAVEAKVNVRGWEADKKEEIKGKIKEETDNNPEISSVDLSEDEVNLNYMAPAKFLGFIPTNVNLNVSADSQGRVKVKFPWYRFLLTTDFGNIGQETEVNFKHIYQNNQTNLEFLKTQDSTVRQLGMFQIISNVLKARHDASQQSISNIK